MDELAVDQRRVGRPLGERSRELGEFFGPIESVARQQMDLAVLDTGEETIAVIFDLVQPFGTSRRRGRHTRQLRLQLSWHRTLAGAWNMRRPAPCGRRGGGIVLDLALLRVPHPVAITGDRFERSAGLDTARV